MPKSQILGVDASSGEPLPIAPDCSLLLSSAGTTWEGLIVVEHQRLPPTETPEVFMPQHTLSLQLKSSILLEYKADGRSQNRRRIPGDVLFMASGAPSRYRWREKSEVLNLALDPAFVAHVAHESFDAERVELVGLHGGFDPQVQHIGLALKAELETGCLGGRLYGESLATALAVHLLRRYTVRPPHVPSYTGGLSKPDLRQIIEYIHVNLSADLRLAEIAQIVSLSPYHFTRLFKGATGLTPRQYVLHCRVEEAKRLLTTEDLSIEEVAQRVGFVDRSHLSRHFRRIVGITPKTLLRAKPQERTQRQHEYTPLEGAEPT